MSEKLPIEILEETVNRRASHHWTATQIAEAKGRT